MTGNLPRSIILAHVKAGITAGWPMDPYHWGKTYWPDASEEDRLAEFASIKSEALSILQAEIEENDRNVADLAALKARPEAEAA